MILGTAGHIDHGKTTLVKALTGVDTDRLPEEKRRGITIVLGFAPLHLDEIGTVGVVDVPGHEAFVRTMVAGATGIDMGLLVIAADEGIMPQTREHVAILEHLGVARGVVALTKVDMVDVEWLSLVEADVATLLSHHEPLDLARGKLREGSVVDWPIIPVSAKTGAGIAELRAALTAVAKTVPAKQTEDLFRLPIDRVFTVKGTGTVVTGTVWSGELRDGATVRVLPENRELRTRGLQNHGHAVPAIGAGDRAAIALVGVEVSEISRGSVVVSDPSWQTSQAARAEVTFDSDDVKIGPRTRVRFHVGTSDVGASVITSEATDPLLSVSRAARLRLDSPLVLRAGDRFVLRGGTPMETIGGGVIVDPLPPKRAKVWPVGLDTKERLRRMVSESGSAGISIDRLPQRLGLRPSAAHDLVASLKSELTKVGPRVWSSSVPDDVAKTIKKLVAEHHRTKPLEKGAPVNDLRTAAHVPSELFDNVLHDLTTTGKLKSDGGLIRQPNFSAELSGADDALANAILTELTAAGAEPPTVTELTPRHGPKIGNVLRFLERSQRVVQVEPGRFYTIEALQAVLDRLKGIMSQPREYTPAELREALGTSRKFLIPLLEYCDRRGLTTRTETGRTWRGKP